MERKPGKSMAPKMFKEHGNQRKDNKYNMELELDNNF